MLVDVSMCGIIILNSSIYNYFKCSFCYCLCKGKIINGASEAGSSIRHSNFILKDAKNAKTVDILNCTRTIW